jgi:CRISPR-associated endonuclease Csn1
LYTSHPTISKQIDTISEPSLSNYTPWRLGLDIGVGSIGWAVLDLHPDKANESGEPISWRPCRLRDIGATIFDSGLDEQGQSANIQRRTYRSARRRFTSVKRRKQYLLRQLIALNCIDENDDARRISRDCMMALPDQRFAGNVIPAVWALRWIALRRPGALTRSALGMILMALASARGQAFADDSDSKKLRPKATELQRRIDMESCVAFGDYAAEMLARTPYTTIRARNNVDHYLSRDMVITEFDAIRKNQETLLPEEAWAQLRTIIFDLVTLQPPRAGSCPLVSGEIRISKAHPDFQKFKIFQVLRNIRVLTKSGGTLEGRENDDARLTNTEIALASKFLSNKRHETPSKLFKAIGLGMYGSNFHDEDIPGDEIGAALSDTSAFGERWRELDDEKRREIIKCAISYLETGTRIPPYASLAQEWELPDETHARAVFERLPRGRGKYGPTATRCLLQRMEEGLSLHDALEAEYPERSIKQSVDRLPYYGHILKGDVFDGDPESESEELRVGRVRNPVVHVVLNQIRGLVNALCDEYGIPVEIVVELVRDIRKTEAQKKELHKRNRERKKIRDKAANIIREVGRKANDDNIDRLILWEELGETGERYCPYSLRPIKSIEEVLDATEIEHIIPRSICGDDSLSNKTIVFRNENRNKENLTPYEWLSPTNYEKVLANAKRVWGKKNRRKYKRFTREAREEFCGKFLNRELTDTAYASRLAREYLPALKDARVYSSRGTITGRLRKAWRLAELLPLSPSLLMQRDEARASNRSIPEEIKRHDYHHHAIDAALVALVDPFQINAYFKKTEEQAKKYPLPWEAFHTELSSLLKRERVVIKHRRKYKPGFEYSGELLQASRYRKVERQDKIYLRKRTQLREFAIDRNGNILPSAKPWDASWLTKQWQDIADTDVRTMLERIFTPQAFDDEYRKARMLSKFDSSEDSGNDQVIDRRAQAQAWNALCLEFSKASGGRSGIMREEVVSHPILVRDKKNPELYHSYKAEQNAYSDIVLQRQARGKLKYSSHVVRLIEAVQKKERPLPQESSKVTRLHKGDMLRLVREGKEFFCIVRSLKENGTIRLALHNLESAFLFMPPYGIFQPFQGLAVR